MKNYLLHLAGTVLLVLVLNAPAAAAGLYVSVLGGAGFLPDAKAVDSAGSVNFSYDAGFDTSIALGYNLGDTHPKIGRGRVELEFNKAANDLDKAKFVEGDTVVDGSVERTSIMLNTIGEYTTRSGIMIYALAGLGWADIALADAAIEGETFVDDSSSRLAYQVGLGLGWQLGRHLVFDIGYRYYGATNPEFTKKDGTSLEYDYACHRVLAGLRLQF